MNKKIFYFIYYSIKTFKPHAILQQNRCDVEFLWCTRCVVGSFKNSAPTPKNRLMDDFLTVIFKIEQQKYVSMVCRLIYLLLHSFMTCIMVWFLCIGFRKGHYEYCGWHCRCRFIFSILFFRSSIVVTYGWHVVYSEIKVICRDIFFELVAILPVRGKSV